MPRLCLALALVLSALTFAARAHAQDERAKRQARKLLKNGDRALQRGDRYAKREGGRRRANAEYEKALSSYLAAYEAYPQPQIYFAIGNAEEKLGRYVDAHGHYKRLLEEAASASDELKAAVNVRIDACLANLAIIDLDAGPEGATIFLDEEELEVAPRDEPLVLEPGPHRISVRKDGFTPGALEIETKPGDKLKKTLHLKRIPEVQVVEPAPPPPPKPLGPPPGRGILLGSLIGTGVFAAGATTLGILALNKHGTFTDEAKQIDEREDAGDAGKLYALTTDIALGATILAAGWTAYYYYGIYRPRAQARIEAATGEHLDARRENDAEPTAWMAPYASSDGGGIAVGGTF